MSVQRHCCVSSAKRIEIFLPPLFVVVSAAVSAAARQRRAVERSLQAGRLVDRTQLFVRLLLALGVGHGAAGAGVNEALIHTLHVAGFSLSHGGVLCPTLFRVRG
jgi:hypothetical protein